jgi:hypothetical protein
MCFEILIFTPFVSFSFDYGVSFVKKSEYVNGFKPLKLTSEGMISAQ